MERSLTFPTDIESNVLLGPVKSRLIACGPELRQGSVVRALPNAGVFAEFINPTSTNNTDQ